MSAIWKYVWNIGLALDQLANAILAGDPDETMSSRLGKYLRSGDCVLCRPVCAFLGWFDPGHCERSIEGDEGRDGFTLDGEVFVVLMVWLIVGGFFAFLFTVVL